MLLDTRKASENKQGFNPNVANDERPATISGGGKFGFIIMNILCWLTIIGGIILLVQIISKNNYFRTQQEKINEAASGIDIQLKKRRDTLVKLVDATKSSIQFEKSLLTEITSLRNVNHFNAKDAKQTQSLDRAARGILATFENYPNLKTTDTIRDLMQTVTILEGEIAAARRLYNSQALQFNQEIQRWWGSYLATKQQCHSFALFVASETDRQDVDCKLM